MRTYVYIAPLIVAVLALAYLILREVMRVWLEHRVKMALLERLEHKPELMRSFEELQDLLDGAQHVSLSGSRKIDLSATGVFLALIGFLCVVIYWLAGRSQWAVGAYFGGVACAVIGFILVTIGLLVRLLRQPPNTPEP